MGIEAFIEKHYQEACNEQRSIKKDPKMTDMLATGDRDAKLVESWMTNYNLFRGINTDNRKNIVNKFLSFADEVHGSSINVVDNEILKQTYSTLFTALFHEVNRSWMSATSKLLWCIYPNDVVIYDSFVKRALVVMQCLDDELAQFPRIGVAPSVKHEQDIASAIDHYMNYHKLVRHLYEYNLNLLNELREKHKEVYPYDIRIIDKLLWMIGNPKYDFKR